MVILTVTIKKIIQAQIILQPHRFSIMTQDVNTRIRLNGVLARLYATGIVTITGKYSAANRTLGMRRTRVMPKDSGFARAVMAKLRSMPWISDASIQHDVKLSADVQQLRRELVKYFAVPSLRHSIHTVLNSLHDLTGEQVKELMNIEHDSQ